MKQHILSAIFSAVFLAASAVSAAAQTVPERVAVEVSATAGHSTSGRFLDTASAGAGVSFGVLLGERGRLTGAVTRENVRLVESRELDNGDDRGTLVGITAAWGIGTAHELSLGYTHSRNKYPYDHWDPGTGMHSVRTAVSESEAVRLGYVYFADWGQAEAGVTEWLGGGTHPVIQANAEYRLNAAGSRTELYALGGAYGVVNGSGKGFSLGLRAKMPKGLNLYASADRNYFGSGANQTRFSLTLVKSFGANAGRIFRRH